MLPVIERLCDFAKSLAVLVFVLWTMCSTAKSIRASDKPLFSQSGHAPSSNEVLLISTRAIGATCNDDAMSNRLKCEQYVANSRNRPQWKSCDLHDIVSGSTDQRPTIVYIHGNRVGRGEDRSKGMQIYRSLMSHGRPDSPIRFIIWSWPSTHIQGPVKDYKVKARRTRPAAWQLAWFLDQLPANRRVSLMGYSYGARIASGAMHVLGGGSLGGLKLEQRIHPQRSPIRVAMMAAAFDADWIQPGHFHGRALSQVEQLVVMTNQLDPIMRFYHLSNGRHGHVDALGKMGVSRPQTLGSAKRRVKRIDFTNAVGRSHSLVDYLAASGKMRSVWQQLLAPDATAQHSALHSPAATQSEGG